MDHTALRPETTQAELKQLCAEARKFSFYSVCVNGGDVILCKNLLTGSEVKVCSVIGFPLGRMDTGVKVLEAKKAIEDGASEIDMVINVGALREGRDNFVKSDIEAVSRICHERDAFLKVIIETALLTNDEKVRACMLSEKAGADFVKTCTGFLGGRASVEDILLMKNAVSPLVKVKASGGISSLSDAESLVKAGASRLGVSKTVEKFLGQDTTGAGY